MAVEIITTITRLEILKTLMPPFIKEGEVYDIEVKRRFFCPIETCNMTGKALSGGKDHYNKNHYDLKYCPVCADELPSGLGNLLVRHFLKKPSLNQVKAMSKEQLTLFTELHFAFAYFHFSCRHTYKNRESWIKAMNMAHKYFMRPIEIKGEVI